MPTGDAMVRVLLTLDWDGEPERASLEVYEAEELRSLLGEGAVRWVHGAVEQSLAALKVRIHDPLAPWPLIRVFAQHVLTSTLLRLTGRKRAAAATQEAIDHNLAGDIVTRDIAFSTVTGALRGMQHEWLSLLIDAAIRVTPDGISAIPALATSVAGTMDEWIGAATDAIVEERRRVDLAAELRLRRTIESLVEADPVDVQAAAQLLRVALDRWHVGCAIGSPPGGAADRRILDGMVQSFGRAFGGQRVVRYESSMGNVHLWATTDRKPRTPLVQDLPVHGALLVGLGEPHLGREGFRRTFVEASDALGLAAKLGHNGGISYREAALAIVLSQDEERARWFVEQELRELRADSPDMADMRTTLRTFFDTRMRIAPAAERLYLHRNTLIHRLERIQVMLGHAVAERSAETQAALVLAELFTSPPDESPPPP